MESNYPVVKPVQYLLEPGHTAVNVPILKMIQKIFNHTDILDKVRETKLVKNDQYVSHQHGLYFKENSLLSSNELKVTLIFNIDDLEIALHEKYRKSVQFTGHFLIYPLSIDHPCM